MTGRKGFRRLQIVRSQALRGFPCALVLLSGCRGAPPLPTEIQPGYSQDEVRQILGEPEVINELILPQAPFFGPQESLVNLIPAGSLVLEWQYPEDRDIRYVWFWGEDEIARETWRVVMTQSYPQDAVY